MEENTGEENRANQGSQDTEGQSLESTGQLDGELPDE